MRSETLQTRFPVGRRVIVYRWQASGEWTRGVIVRNDGESVDVAVDGADRPFSFSRAVAGRYLRVARLDLQNGGA